MVLNLPKNPKIDDLVGVISSQDERLTELEAYVTRNDERITRLETYAAQVIAERGRQIDELQVAIAHHQEGAVRRQQEVNQIQADSRRMRWAMRHHRNP